MPIIDLTKSHLVLIYLKIVVSNNSEKEDSTFLLFFLNILIYCFEEDKNFVKNKCRQGSIVIADDLGLGKCIYLILLITFFVV